MNAVIEITGQIIMEDGFRVAGQILKANKASNVQNIVLLINSGGGNTYAIPPIREAVEMADKNVICVGFGMVASTAMAIFMMGKERMMAEDTLAIIHKATNGVKEETPPEYDIEEALQLAKLGTQRAWRSVIENSSLTKAFLEKKCKQGDWILTQEEVKKHRIITKPYNREEVKALVMDI